MGIGRKKHHSEPAPHRQAPPPEPPPVRHPNTPSNVAILVYEAAHRLAPLLARRGAPVGTPLWTQCHELAGACLANGGSVGDAVSAAEALLDLRLGQPAPRPAPIAAEADPDTGVEEKPPSQGVSDISLTEDEEDLPL